MHLLIIGGSDAGVSAALRARELDPRIEVTMAVADDFPNFSICGLPYYLSGETPDWRSLAHRTEFPGINVLRQHVAEVIDPVKKSVLIRNSAGAKTYSYDKLVIATGAEPVRPDLPGANLDGVYVLHTMDDSFAVHRHLSQRSPNRALIIGAGYIGLEMADALTQRGLAVTLLSRSRSVLPTIDSAHGQLVENELRQHGVVIHTDATAISISKAGDGSDGLCLVDSNSASHQADLIIFAVGVRPNSELAARAGANLGAFGAIQASKRMETNLPDVYAAGDCIETYHRLLGRHTYISLGTIAHKQGRVAGENAVGGDREFAGAVGTQSIKVFELAVARTGLLEHEARSGGFDPVTVPIRVNDHKAYYPGSTPLDMLLTGDRSTGRLLGAQIIGSRKAEVSKRIDIVAAALFQGASVEDLNDMDLSYTPPFSSPWDPVQMAAQAWAAEVAGRLS